jgi:hypothetical protein
MAFSASTSTNQAQDILDIYKDKIAGKPGGSQQVIKASLSEHEIFSNDINDEPLIFPFFLLP